MTRPLALAALLAAAALAAGASAAPAPAPAVASSALDGSDVRVLSAGAHASRPLPARDGRILVLRGGPAFLDLWVMGPDGGEARKLVDEATQGYGLPAWSPTGDAFATTGWDDSPCTPSTRNCAIAEIRVHDAETGEVRARLRSRGRGGYRYSWSPDGRRIASLGESDMGLSAYSVEVANADGSGRRVLVRSTFPNWFSEVAWSPRGDWIAYVRKGWIWLVRPAGGTPVRAAKGTRLLWSPRGQLLYSAGRTRRLLDPATRRSRLLLAAPASIASWSPDGTRLVYRANYDGVSTLAVARASDGRVVSRARIEGKVDSVHFTPDGRRLLYSVRFD